MPMEITNKGTARMAPKNPVTKDPNFGAIELLLQGKSLDYCLNIIGNMHCFLICQAIPKEDDIEQEMASYTQRMTESVKGNFKRIKMVQNMPKVASAGRA
jgi:hypothetical protein